MGEINGGDCNFGDPPRGLDTPNLYEPAFICHKMFEPIIEYDGELINVNAIERVYTCNTYTRVVFKGKEDTVLYQSHDLFDLIKGTIPR